MRRTLLPAPHEDLGMGQPLWLPLFFQAPAADDNRVALGLGRFQRADENTAVHPLELAHGCGDIDDRQFVGIGRHGFIDPDAVVHRQDRAIIHLHFIQRIQRFKAIGCHKLPVCATGQNNAGQPADPRTRKHLATRMRPLGILLNETNRSRVVRKVARELMRVERT